MLTLAHLSVQIIQQLIYMETINQHIIEFQTLRSFNVIHRKRVMGLLCGDLSDSWPSVSKN